MTTITKEEAQAVWDLSAGYTLGNADVEILQRLARIALASLTAEPVAWRYRTTDINGNPRQGWSFSEEESLMGLYQPLYAAPSAPVVPPERPADSSNGDDVEAWFDEGWNACRAAMLQGNHRDLSQPVDPQVAEYESIMLQAGNSPVNTDGWVMVPIEPTDDMIAAAMNCDDVLFNSDESFCVQFGNIYAAMIAAAPQQEVIELPPNMEGSSDV